MISRRHLLLTPAVALLGAVAASQTQANAGSKQFDYQIFREGSVIGRHRSTVSWDKDRTVVRTEIDIEVHLLLIRVFRYRHESREEWSDGMLTRFVSKSDDNGNPWTVDGRATEAGFEVTSNEETFTAPAAIVPASFWDRRILDASHLLDTTNGSMLRVWVERGRIEQIKTPTGPVVARRYTFRGDMDVVVWYAMSGELSKLVLRTGKDSSAIEYYPAG